MWRKRISNNVDIARVMRFLGYSTTTQQTAVRSPGKDMSLLMPPTQPPAATTKVSRLCVSISCPALMGIVVLRDEEGAGFSTCTRWRHQSLCGDGRRTSDSLQTYSGHVQPSSKEFGIGTDSNAMPVTVVSMLSECVKDVVRAPEL